MGSIHVPIPPQVINPALFPDWEYNTDLVGELVMSGLFVPGLPWPGPGLVKIEVGIPGLPLP